MDRTNKDIVEIFGYAAADPSIDARKSSTEKLCPFREGACIKCNHDKSIVYGVCAVTEGKKKNFREVIVCPNRVYQDDYRIFASLIEDAWDYDHQDSLVIGGDFDKLQSKAMAKDNPIIGFGHASGSEVSVP